jgi:hypothetical protein
MVLDALNVDHTLEPLQPKPFPPRSWREARSGDLVWARQYFVPWVLRRLRNQSSGDGVTAKRPTPGPVFGPGVPLGSGEGPVGTPTAARNQV